MSVDIAIIGGGLAGMALAEHLVQVKRDFMLFEARDRLGGRILSTTVGGEKFDLGPAWYWPGQHRMQSLVDRLDLHRFTQYSSGDQLYEDERGSVHRALGFASMEGAYRLRDGMATLVHGLKAGIPSNRIVTSAKLTELNQDGTLHFSDGKPIRANNIVLALPPRLISQFRFMPQLGSAQHKALTDIPTWMGGQAKIVVVYETPFWKEAGLSGDAMSRLGPMVEIHDATPERASAGALFGFVGVPPSHRTGNAEPLKAAAINQLTRLFGPTAAKPIEVLLADWAMEAETSHPLDSNRLNVHPVYGPVSEFSDMWEGRIHLCSTETAPEMGGFLEGSLAAAEETAHHLLSRTEAIDASPDGMPKVSGL